MQRQELVRKQEKKERKKARKKERKKERKCSDEGRGGAYPLGACYTVPRVRAKAIRSDINE